MGRTAESSLMRLAPPGCDTPISYCFQQAYRFQRAYCCCCSRLSLPLINVGAQAIARSCRGPIDNDAPVGTKPVLVRIKPSLAINVDTKGSYVLVSLRLFKGSELAAAGAGGLRS